jgi:hypothetical protein
MWALMALKAGTMVSAMDLGLAGRPEAHARDALATELRDHLNALPADAAYEGVENPMVRTMLLGERATLEALLLALDAASLPSAGVSFFNDEL